MFPIPDALAAFYLFCFALGFVFVFASLFLGLSHDTLHLPGLGGGDSGVGDAGGADGGAGVDTGADTGGSPGTHDAGHATATGGHAHQTGHGISPVNLSTIMAFLTWFGGAGYILRVYAGVAGVLSLVAASLMGLLGGAIIFYFLVRVLIPGQRILDPADYRVEGTLARVSIPIRPGSVGEIVYTKDGTRRSEGARSANDSAIERGTEVVVVKYERGIAYVEPWSSFVTKG